MKDEICHLTSAHPRYDVRIFEKECKALSSSYQVNLIVADGLGNEVIEGIKIIDTGERPKNKIIRIIFTPWKIYRKALKQVNCKYFHFHDPELLFVGFALEYLHSRKVIYDVHEDVPQDILLKKWIPSYLRTLISRVYLKIEHFISKRISGIVCATPYIKSRFIGINPICYDIKNYPILKNQISRKQINRTDVQYDLCYIGLISEHRGIFELLRILDSIDVKIALAGPFESEALKARLVESKNWSKVSYHGVLNRSEVQTLLVKSFIGVVVLRRTPTFVTSLPIKLFEYMAAGMPVIASNFPVWRDIIDDANCGICIDPEDYEQFLLAVQKLMKNKEEASLIGRRGLEAVQKKYSWEAESETLLKLYKAL